MTCHAHRYPFPLHVNITYTLSADGFRVDTRARNVPRHSYTTLNAATGSATTESAATASGATTGASSELEIDAVVGAGLDAALEFDDSALDVGQPLPFFNGWHSYFKVGDISKAVLTLDRCRWESYIMRSVTPNLKANYSENSHTEL